MKQTPFFVNRDHPAPPKHWRRFQRGAKSQAIGNSLEFLVNFVDI